MGIAAAGADMMPHSATPVTRLIARAFTGTSVLLLHRRLFIGIVRIASMSRRRAKCIVSIAGIGRGFSDLLLTRGPAPDSGALWSDVEGHGSGRSTSLRPAAAPDFFRCRVNFWCPGRDQSGAGVGQSDRNGAAMRAPNDFRLSVLGGVAIGLLAFAVPAAATVPSSAEALATSLDDAWRACNAPQLSSADRIAHCTTIIESGRAKPVARAQALMARGFGYVFPKDFDRALADFDAAIRNNPKLAAAYYYRGAIQRDPKRALADINKAISLNPRDPDYFRERSSLYAKRKEYPRAIADLTAAIGLAKKPTREYFLRGAAYEDIGQRDKAIADFQASLVLDPDNDVLRRHLVRLGGEIPKAVQLPSGLCSANDITHEQRI